MPSRVAPSLASRTMSSDLARAVGARPLYLPSPLALAMPSRWRSNLISRSNCATLPITSRIAPADRLLTAAEFHRLADVPPEVEWFANLGNAHTRRAYENAVKDFMRFTGIA